MNALVVVYSLTGTTRQVAEKIAKRLDADLIEIQCNRSFSGVFGFMRAAIESLLGRFPNIAPLQRKPSDYDLVIAGAPLWAGHGATPLRAFLKHNADQIRSVAFFITYGGSMPDDAFSELEELAGQSSRENLALSADDIKGDKVEEKTQEFVRSLKT